MDLFHRYCALLPTSLVCFTLALEWGGQSRPWNDGSVIATLVIWITLTIAWVVVEWVQDAYAMVHLAFMRSRMTWPSALYSLM